MIRCVHPKKQEEIISYGKTGKRKADGKTGTIGEESELWFLALTLDPSH